MEALNSFDVVCFVTWAAVFSFPLFYYSQRLPKIIQTSLWALYFLWPQIKSLKRDSSFHKDNFDIFILRVPQLNKNNSLKNLTLLNSHATQRCTKFLHLLPEEMPKTWQFFCPTWPFPLIDLLSRRHFARHNTQLCARHNGLSSTLSPERCYLTLFLIFLYSNNEVNMLHV